MSSIKTWKESVEEVVGKPTTVRNATGSFAIRN